MLSVGPEGSYLDPPIREAVVEFRFHDFPWKTTFPGMLAVHPDIRPFYDGEPREQHHITAHLSVGSGAPPSQRADEVRTQLVTSAGDRVVTVGPRSLSVSTLKPYDGWDAFRQRVERAFDAHRTLAGTPRSLSRVGVRYINELSVPDSMTSVSDYFACGPREVEGLIDARDPFAYRTARLLSDGTHLTLSLSTLPGPGRFCLDFDLAHVTAAPLPEEAAITHVERLHAHARSVFESCITDRTRELLNRGAR